MAGFLIYDDAAGEDGAKKARSRLERAFFKSNMRRCAQSMMARLRPRPSLVAISERALA
jgi:hypothetical protein